MAYSAEKLIYWADKQAFFDENIKRGCFCYGDGRWATTDGFTMFVLEHKPRGLPEIKPDDLVPILRGGGGYRITEEALRKQNPHIAEVTTSDIEAEKKKQPKEKWMQVFWFGETAFDIKKTLQIAAVMGKGCRYYCAGKTRSDWLWVYPSDTMNNFAVLMPVNGTKVQKGE